MTSNNIKKIILYDILGLQIGYYKIVLVENM